MSESPQAPAEAQPLQFETAEPIGAAPGPLVCTSCKQPLVTEYFETSGQVVCPSCRNNIAAAVAAGGGKERFILATVYGGGAALAGALLWWGVRALTGYEIGLIAVAVGFGVGFALWEAWKINRQAQLVFTGPFRVSPAADTGETPASTP